MPTAAASVATFRSVRSVSVPTFLYGTAWKEDRTRELVRLALDAGFRGIDTANQRKHYHEAAVGEAVTAAIAEGKVKREDLFLQTKFTFLAGQDHRLPYDPDAKPAVQVEQSFASSLVHLGTPYVDSYVLHGPSGRFGLNDADWEVWTAMEGLHDAGRTRLLGVSNIGPEQLSSLCANAFVKPDFVQNRCFARTGWDRKVREICTANGIVYQGFSLLTANVTELQKPMVQSLVRRTGRPLPAVVFRFAQQVGLIPLTGTTSAEHMREDLLAYDFELAETDVRLLETIAT